jgi:hypothetical protein
MQQLGYVTYRRVKGYYSGEEDALDMRKVRYRLFAFFFSAGVAQAFPPHPCSLSLSLTHTHTSLSASMNAQSLPRDTARAAMVPLGRDITPAELDFD